jgi:parallel beta-helix repeat protein
MTIRTSAVLKAQMPIGQTGASTAQDVHDVIETFAARTKCLNDYFVAGDTNPSHDAFVRLAADIQSGDTVYIDSGTHTLMSQITISAKDGVNFRLSRNARIRLTNRAWNTDGARVGIAFHDCNDLTIDGGVWDANGTQNNALNTDARNSQVSVLAVVSNVAAASATIQSRRINIRNARFIDLFMTGLSLVKTEDAVIENCQFTDPGYVRTKDLSDAPYLGLALAHRTRVRNCSFHGGYNANDTIGQHPGQYSGIIASAAQMAGHLYRTLTDSGRFEMFGGVAALQWTAPASGRTTTQSWTALQTWSTTFSPSTMRFLHLTKNRNNAADISPGRLVCTAIDNSAKTITFALNNLTGGTTNPVPAFAGQTMVTFGYNPSGMMKDLTVEGCYFHRMGGAGVFLWGVDGYIMRGNTCFDNRDIGLDAENSVNGVIANNTFYNTPGYTNSAAIAVLELAHNVTVTGNVMRLFDTVYGINIETGGPIISDITVSGNTIVGADIRLRGGGQTGAGCNTGYINIVGNTIDGNRAEGGTGFVHNIGIDTVGVCRDVAIMGNVLLNSAQAPVKFQGVDGLTIMNNTIVHTQWAGIAYEEAVATVNTSRRVSILNNLLHDTGQGWRDGYGLLRRFGTTSTETPRISGNHFTVASGNVNYSLSPPDVSVNDAAVTSAGFSPIKVGTIWIRDNAGVLEKSTNATAPNNGTWTAV